MGKKFLDYDGLQRLVQNINQKYAPIQALVFKATVPTISSLPNLDTVKAGWMYNVTKGGQTTADFVDGAGKTLQDGENVVAVNINTLEYPVMKWDILGGVFRIDDRVQFGEVFPTTDLKQGDLFLYMGETTYRYIEIVPQTGDNPLAKGWYEFNDSTEQYVLSEDTTVQQDKTYYRKVEQYVTGQIYFYNVSGNEWVKQPYGDVITSISIGDIENLFN